MDLEKNPTSLYVPPSPFEGPPTKPKKSCSKTLLSIVLASLLIALIIALCVQFLVPYGRVRETEIDTIQVFEDRSRKWKHLHESAALKGTVGPFPSDMDFLVNPTELCGTSSPPESEKYRSRPEILLLMLVPSAADHYEQRRAIRRTWGSVSAPDGPMRLAFILNSSTNDTEEMMILSESGMYRDIIQTNIEESSKNLTAKSMVMLKWVAKYCAHAQYVLKTSDDAFVNLDAVSQILAKEPYRSSGPFIGGFIRQIEQPIMSQFMPFDDYLNTDLPPYIAGPSYLTSGPTAADLYESCQQLRPLFPMEDMFVTGLCADQIGASLIHEPTFGLGDPVKPASWDTYSNLATAHSVTPDEIDQVWDEMQKSLVSSMNWAGPFSDIFSVRSPLPRITIARWPMPNSDPGQGLTKAENDLFQSVLPEVKSMFNMMNVPMDLFDPMPLNQKPGKKTSLLDLLKGPSGQLLPDTWKVVESNEDSEPVMLARAKITLHMFPGPEGGLIVDDPDMPYPQIAEGPITLPTVQRQEQKVQGEPNRPEYIEIKSGPQNSANLSFLSNQ